jgi:hypothetical protein
MIHFDDVNLSKNSNVLHADYKIASLQFFTGDLLIFTTEQDLKQKRNRFEDTHFGQVFLRVVSFVLVCSNLLILSKSLSINKDGVFGRNNMNIWTARG